MYKTEGLLLVKIQKRQEAGNGACVGSRIRFADEWMRGMGVENYQSC